MARRKKAEAEAEPKAKPKPKAAAARVTTASLSKDIDGLRWQIERATDKAEKIDNERILLDARLTALKNAQLEFISDETYAASQKQLQAEAEADRKAAAGAIARLEKRIAALESREKTTRATAASMGGQIDRAHKLLFAGAGVMLAWLAVLTIFR